MPPVSRQGLIGGRFEIGHLVAEGGMGAVYRALDRTTGEPVALKFVLAGDQKARAERDERFDREIRLLATIEHPRIARYVGHGTDSNGRAFLAMQWLDGHDLGNALAAGRLSPADSLRVLVGAAEAMAAVHERGIVHRDFKPSNLFLRAGSPGDVVLLDFGVSRRLNASAFLTGTAIVGTPHYMAPEQVSSLQEILPAADVFSIGCVFYECLTGKRPFDAGQLYGVLARILYDTPAPVQTEEPSIPDAWSALLTRMLDKRPAARPADGAALLRELALLPPAEAHPAAAARSSHPPAAEPTSSDQVLVCVVLVTLPGATRDADADADNDAAFDRFASIRSAMHRFGCPIERLADGSLLATVLPRQSATDLVHIAARCAIYLRDQMPDAQIAVATGRAPLGPSPRVGEAVDRAAQLLERALPADGILIDGVTRDLLDGRFVTASRPSAQDPAVSTSDSVKILVGERPDFDASRPLLGKPTPCVGRELELIQLEGVMSGALDEGVSKAAVVLGPPGIGKSRLRHELLRRFRHQHPSAALLVGYGDPLSAGSPYVLLADALRRHAGIRVGDDPASARDRITDQLCGAIDPSQRQRVSEFIGELAGVPFPGDQSPPLRAARADHRVMSEQIALAFLDWLAAECAAHPVILVLEDLQWGDALTVKLLEGALRDLEQGSLFLLALGRPEVEEIFPKLLGGQRSVSLSLRALSTRASEILVKGVLGEDVGGEALERMVRLSAGNALFLEELIRAAAEGKAGDVPETVLAMLQSRLSRLEPEARLVLRAASVFGETFWRGGVRWICEAWGTADDPDVWLAHLVDGELIARRRSSGFPGEVEYAFRHALVCDAAGGLLTGEDRQSGHLASGRWLETMGETDWIVLARHAEGGGDRERAIGFYARAAEQSVGRYDFDEALARANKGIALGAEGQTLGLLRSVRASAFYSTGRWIEAAEAGLSTLDLVQRGDAAWCATVETLMQVLPNVDQFARSEELSDEVLKIVPAPEARTAFLRAVALQLVGFAISASHRRGQACLDFIDELRVPEEDLLVRGYTRLYRSIFTYILGRDIPRSLALAEQSGRDLAESQVVYRLSLAEMMQSFMCWGLGDHGRGERAARQSRATAVGIRDDYHAALASWYLGLTLAEQEDPARLDEVEPCAEAMLKLQRTATSLDVSRVLTARAALGRNDLVRAEADGRAARAGLFGMPLFRLMASTHLLNALLRQRREAEAAAIARQDLVWLGRIGGPVCSEVMFRVAAAEALFEAGDPSSGEAALREALRQIDLRASFMSEAGVKEKYLTGREENRRAAELALAWRLGPPPPS